MRVAVPGRRATVEQLPGGVRYRIPAKRHAFALVFLPLWLVGWGFGEVTALRSLLHGDESSSVFLWVWVTLWTFGGFGALYSWLAQMIGEELVTLTPTTLAIKREVTGLEPTREYELVKVHNLRVSSEPAPAGTYAHRNGSVFAGGWIAFDYGAKTFHFGAGIDSPEATEIVTELNRRQRFAR